MTTPTAVEVHPGAEAVGDFFHFDKIVSTRMEKRELSPASHVQGVRLNRTIFLRGERPARVCDCMAL
jgi:hypothetical protein